MSNKKKAVDLEVEPIVKTLPESVNPIAIYNLKKESAIRFLIALYEEIQARIASGNSDVFGIQSL